MEDKKDDEVKFDISQLETSPPESLNDILTRSVRRTWRPKVAHLQDAVVDGKLIVPVGGKVLIQYPKDASRDTTCWIVAAVFEAVPEGYTVSPGYVRLYDPVRTHYGATNYLEAEALGLVLKVPDKSRKWFAGEEENLMMLAKKRRRKKFAKEEEEETTPTPVPVPVAEPGKKKRGRPKGSKNKATLAKSAA